MTITVDKRDIKSAIHPPRYGLNYTTVIECNDCLVDLVTLYNLGSDVKNATAIRQISGYDTADDDPVEFLLVVPQAECGEIVIPREIHEFIDRDTSTPPFDGHIVRLEMAVFDIDRPKDNKDVVEKVRNGATVPWLVFHLASGWTVTILNDLYFGDRCAAHKCKSWGGCQ